MNVVELAKQIAIEAHKGQSRRGGGAYISHPAAVAASVSGDDAKAVAWLHDVLEDTKVTEKDLRAKGIPDSIIQAVKLLTKKAGESRLDYYKKIKTNALAKKVKIQDMLHNMHDTPSQYQIVKYTQGLKFLKGEINDKEYLENTKEMKSLKMSHELQKISYDLNEIKIAEKDLAQKKKDYIKNMNTDKMEPMEFVRTKKKIKSMTEEEFETMFKTFNTRGYL